MEEIAVGLGHEINGGDDDGNQTQVNASWGLERVRVDVTFADPGSCRKYFCWTQYVGCCCSSV